MSINSTSRQCLLLCTGVAVAAALGCAPAESERDASAAPSGASGDTAAVVTPTWATAIDSTRDTVVVRTDSVSDAETAVRLVEELRIGDANDDDPRVLGEIRFVVPTPRGGVYVWDQSATQLREYDDRGRFARDIGRSGAGPAPGTREKREQLAFDVFSRDGYLLGSVQPPPESRITFMRGDNVWGVVSDDMGRSVAVRWRIEPSLAARERGHRAKATMASPIASARLNTH